MTKSVEPTRKVDSHRFLDRITQRVIKSWISLSQPGEIPWTPLAERSSAGSVSHLPFGWVEPVPKLTTQPPETPPITQHLVRHPWDLPRFLRRDPPDRV